MTIAFSGVRSQATVEDATVPNQAEIEREIVKLEEDSARDVQRQLKQQRLAATEGEVKEDVRDVAVDVRESLAHVWKAAEQKVDMITKDTEAGVERRMEGHCDDGVDGSKEAK